MILRRPDHGAALTLFDKVWNDHVIGVVGDGAYLLHVDRNFLHELSGAVSLRALDARGRQLHSPALTFGTLDHVLETTPERGMTTRIPGGNDFLHEFSTRAVSRGIHFFGLDDMRQGIVHVIAPELGIVMPGMTFVCGDSHTCTVGGVGAFAWGVGTSESEHVLATQTIVQTKPKRMRVNFEGTLASGVFAKDMILALIGRHGAGGGAGYAIEFAGSTVRTLPMSGRFTLCNMAVEFGGRTGMVAPDDITFDFLYEREFSPKDGAWDSAVIAWRLLPSDMQAIFDAEITLDCSTLVPQVSWGTSPEHVIGIDEVVPYPEASGQADAGASRVRAMEYMGLKPGERLLGQPIEGVFIGSCTNSRLDDLREAAAILKGRKVAPGILAICSPGSSSVKRAAELEGLDKVFIEAGFAWRESGCSLCVSGGMGGESFSDGARVVASTNRNFEHRQGRNVRSHLASPATVAASAVMGVIADARWLEI